MSFDFDFYLAGFHDAFPFLGGIKTPWDVTRQIDDWLPARSPGWIAVTTASTTRASAFIAGQSSNPGR